MENPGQLRRELKNLSKTEYENVITEMPELKNICSMTSVGQIE